MPRRLVVVVAAIGVAGGLAIAAIWLATEPGGLFPGRGAAPTIGFFADGTPMPTGPVFNVGPAAGGPVVPPAPIVTDPPPPPPPPGSWEAVPILASRRGGSILRFDEYVMAKLSECWDSSVASRSGPVSQTKDFAPLEDRASTILLLQFEVVNDEALVVDAPVESKGSASTGTIACAQQLLRNQRTAAGGLPAGRHRARMVLAP